MKLLFRFLFQKQMSLGRKANQVSSYGMCVINICYGMCVKKGQNREDHG